MTRTRDNTDDNTHGNTDGNTHGAMLAATVDVTVGAFRLSASVEASEGTIVAVVGGNGSGKTTLLRALAGLQPLHGGRIVLGGAVLDDPETGAFVPPQARPIGMVFQDDRLFDSLSALDNVAFGLRARGTDRRSARTEATRWLDRLGLTPEAARRADRLSGGQRQRVGLARALATAPRLLLLDEPFSAASSETRQVMRDLVRADARERGTVIVLVTHDPSDVSDLADQTLTLAPPDDKLENRPGYATHSVS